jgi:glucose-1-phosphate cytidylyltransferase
VKTVILAGGLGTRLQEETTVKPKPMVEIGGRPILWHIMKTFGHFGFKEFVVALGYRGEVIKRYFLDYRHHATDLSIELASGRVEMRAETPEDWLVHLVDTGARSETGGRLRRLKGWLSGETFMMTYGDGVANLDIRELLRFHRRHGRLATITAVRPPSRFGGLKLAGDEVVDFEEKPQIGEGWINGGFFVLEPAVLDLIGSDDVLFEGAPLERLAAEKQLVAYRHEGFWQCMDTLRDVRLLESLWQQGNAPWNVWQ